MAPVILRAIRYSLWGSRSYRIWRNVFR